MSLEDLRKLRTEIKEIDQNIITLIANRMQVVRKIGEIKKKMGLPIKDYKVEKEILERSSEEARKLNVDVGLVYQVLKLIINDSVREQGAIKNARQRLIVEQKQTCLVIGGHGQMGNWLANFMDTMGYEISIYDQASSLKGNKNYQAIETIDSSVLQSFNFIFLATPMTATNAILLDIAKAKPSGIVVEICSLKQPILEGLKALKDAKVQIVSMHPMFGPDINYLAGRNIIFCHESDNYPPAYQTLKSIFAQTSANLIDLPLDQHDDFMSIVLNASHIFNLAFAKLIVDSEIKIEKLFEIAGTTFTKQLTLTSNVVNENPNLYYEIQRLNPNSAKLYAKLLESLNNLFELVLDSKKHEFKLLMKKCKRALNFLPTRPITPEDDL